MTHVVPTNPVLEPRARQATDPKESPAQDLRPANAAQATAPHARARVPATRALARAQRPRSYA